jgi:hypothetical protein
MHKPGNTGGGNAIMSIFRALTRHLRRTLAKQAERYNAMLLADLGLKH